MKQYTKVDQYDREYLAAPEDMVLKGYLVYNWGTMERCLVDEYGCVFVTGRSSEYTLGGWSSRQHSPHCRLIVLPNPVPSGNDPMCPNAWDFDGWHGRNWQCDSWAWMYEGASSARNMDTGQYRIVA